tara:strand:- start:550 stop:663 length:114 start_codon:yes stop_codon:yes gene_type:complete
MTGGSYSVLDELSLAEVKYLIFLIKIEQSGKYCLLDE